MTRPGKRQAERSRAALKKAFGGLLASKGYGEISVREIADGANVGRSTFYRHFKSKADVLVALHEDIFVGLFVEECSEERWLGRNVPPQLNAFVSRYCLSGGPMVSLSADIGGDADYIMHHVVKLLAACVEESISKSFPSKESSIPLPVLASSIAGTYFMVLMSVRDRLKGEPGERVAEYVHRLSRAAVQEAYSDK